MFKISNYESLLSNEVLLLTSERTKSLWFTNLDPWKIFYNFWSIYSYFDESDLLKIYIESMQLSLMFTSFNWELNWSIQFVSLKDFLSISKIPNKLSKLLIESSDDDRSFAVWNELEMLRNFGDFFVFSLKSRMFWLVYKKFAENSGFCLI